MMRTSQKVRSVTGSLLILVAAMAAGMGAYAVQSLNLREVADILGIPDETDHQAPIDYGAGPGKPKASVTTQVSRTSASTIPTGGTSASTMGVFGAPVTWPIIPIHVILLPDNRLMSYGTDESGNQGAQLFYDVWDPSQGTDSSSHTVLPNSTSTDIFCGTQSLMLSGEVLTSGGDLTVNGARNSANNQTTIFSPSANTLTSNTAMSFARWYSTLVGLPNGQLAVFGGRQNVGALTPVIPSTTPEMYDPSLRTWTSLTGATSSAAFGANWWYPRAFVAPGGNIFVLMNTNGKMFYLSTAGSGSIRQSSVTVPATGNIKLPTVSFAPGKVLSVRLNQLVYVVDYTTPIPVVTQTDSIDAVRYWANGTVLADGRVLVTGGSAQDNLLVGVDYQAEIWDPNTGHWTAGASATKPRLYHSNSVLLSDGTVLTGGGGAPGPLINLNAEIYYPPYLYAADGTPAARPTLSSTNLSVYDPGATLVATVGATDVISRLTLIRAGSSTHSLNADARFIQLSFTQSGQTLTATLPSDTSVLVPGYYMLFALNTAGVPSVARIFPITANAPATNFSLSPTSVAFGTVQVGSSSTPQTVTLTNSGGTLPAPSITFSGAGASRFSQTNTCGNSIPSGSTCTMSVVFRPTTAGAAKATLNVTASVVTQTAALSGTGSEPFTVSPTSVSFGSVTVGTSSAARPLTVTNTGSAALPITSITLTGSAPSQFSQTNNCGTSVPVGSSCTINVTFTPASKGLISAKVNVASPGASHSSNVSGTGQ